MKASRKGEFDTGHPPVLSTLILGAAACMLAGCSSFRTVWGRPLAADVGQFSEGSTRVETVIDTLGPPAQISALPDGFAFLYEHSIVSEFQLGISVNAPLLKWIKFVRASNRLDQDILLMLFDDQGVLQSMDPEAWKEKLGGGGAAQFLFSAISLTDDSALRQLSPQHEWGQYALLRLPVLLNSQQSLRTGQHGLQQRLAPLFAGQATLEMPQPKPLKNKRKKDYR